MLHISEFKTLLFELTLSLAQFFSFRIQLGLHFIKVGVKHSNRLLEVINLLVLAEQLAFISLNIVKQHCFLSVTTSLLSQRRLELRKQLVFGLI